MTSQATTPRVYVACIASYNAGKLHGVWIDLEETQDVEDIQAAIDAMLAASPEPGAEEYVVHDHEGCCGLIDGECCNVDDLEAVAAKIGEVAEHHREAFEAWVEGRCGDDPTAFLDAYAGEWDSEQEYAEEYIDGTGMLDGVDPSIANYFDCESFARDLFMDMNALDAPRGGIFVFYN